MSPSLTPLPPSIATARRPMARRVREASTHYRELPKAAAEELLDRLETCGATIQSVTVQANGFGIRWCDRPGQG